VLTLTDGFLGRGYPEPDRDLNAAVDGQGADRACVAPAWRIVRSPNERAVSALALLPLARGSVSSSSVTPPYAGLPALMILELRYGCGAPLIQGGDPPDRPP
jgi:hypothetical protein